MRYIKKFNQIFETLNALSHNNSEINDLFLHIADEHNIVNVELDLPKEWTNSDKIYYGSGNYKSYLSKLHNAIKNQSNHQKNIDHYRYSIVKVDDYFLLIIFNKMNEFIETENMHEILIDLSEFLSKLDQLGYSGEYVIFKSDIRHDIQQIGGDQILPHNYYSSTPNYIILKITEN